VQTEIIYLYVKLVVKSENDKIKTIGGEQNCKKNKKK